MLLVGYWANTFPIKYIYTRILDILFVLGKNVDLRQVLVNEENVTKFLKGVYLLVKAFPKLNEDILEFLKTVRGNVNYIVSDVNLNSKTQKMMERTFYFLENIIIKSEFENKNTLYMKI